MPKIERFEDLIAWQKARSLVQDIYALLRDTKLGKDFILRDQIIRAAISVMSNIAEGFERGGRPEFHQYLSTAKASCAEVRSQLYVVYDAGYIPDDVFVALMDKTIEVGRILGGLRSAVAKQRDDQKTMKKKN